MNKPGGVLSGKVDTGMCGPDMVAFQPLMFTKKRVLQETNGLDIGCKFVSSLV